MHPVGFIIKKFVTMHGHMNVKKGIGLFAFTTIHKLPFSLPCYCGINTWEGTNSTVRGKYKWLFINDCACKSLDFNCDGTFKVMQKWNKCIILFGDNVGKY